MKTLFNEFFYISEDGKIREKVMIARIAVSVIFMVLCLTAMSYTAYAYFTCSVSSDLNTIQSAQYSLEIKDSSDAVVTGAYTCKEVTDDLHTFTFTPNGTAETGYCKIEISNGTEKKIYYTTQIFKEAGENTDRLTELTLTIQAAEGCVITFIPQWGTSANYAVNQEELYGVGDKTTIVHSTTPDGNIPSTSGDDKNNDAPQDESENTEQVQPNAGGTEGIGTDTETKTETETETEGEIESETEEENTTEESESTDTTTESTDTTTDDTESASPTVTDAESQGQPEVPEGE
ncbi:MAG: hypothetical protein IJZ53_00725 [Tyzzerella sp.]|nr:hypothetical protein [Tyzzerella sp.]